MLGFKDAESARGVAQNAFGSFTNAESAEWFFKMTCWSFKMHKLREGSLKMPLFWNFKNAENARGVPQNAVWNFENACVGTSTAQKVRVVTQNAFLELQKTQHVREGALKMPWSSTGPPRRAPRQDPRALRPPRRSQLIEAPTDYRVGP